MDYFQKMSLVYKGIKWKKLLIIKRLKDPEIKRTQWVPKDQKPSTFNRL